MPTLIEDCSQYYFVIKIASTGAFSAIGQHNLKRLLAYSSISHMGFALMGVINGSFDGVRSLSLYMLIYLVMSLALFISIIALKTNDEHIENIEDISGLAKINPVMALIISILLFSLAGIPPLAGFFAKFYVLYAAIDAKLYYLAIFGVLSSVISAFYYLRIIKVMYFEESAISFDPISKRLKTIIYLLTAITLLFFLRPSIFINFAGTASGFIYMMTSWPPNKILIKRFIQLIQPMKLLSIFSRIRIFQLVIRSTNRWAW